MFQFDTSRDKLSRDHVVNVDVAIYTREAFRAILARQPEWKIRTALEEGNIPSSNIEHAVEWLEEQSLQRPRYLS